MARQTLDRPAVTRLSAGALPPRIVAIALIVSSMSVAGCGNVNNALEKVTQARQAAGDLLVQFTKAADASNRAVMADTDEASVAFAREAEGATAAVQKSADALGPILQGLGYSDEVRLLGEFTGHFAEYRALDTRILDLAVENTNLKAQRLAFGPAQEAADRFRDDLKSLVAAVPSKDAWQVQALAASAVTTVREIQVLQSPHIANADEAVMTRMELEMATSEKTARTALDALGPLVAPASRAKLAAATASLDQFMKLNVEIIALSRRNTNVRSLALSLDEKRKLVSACEDSLHALQAALAKRGYIGIR